ncbi:MAG: hypothetical protein AVDCRST_MAG93-4756, partial [uncultured Chloroflexia bacterium]
WAWVGQVSVISCSLEVRPRHSS